MLALLLTLSAAVAETPASRSVRISFLPPPLEGTISLGIYDGGGKLVRVLHREADLEAFETGKDALKTTWDGNDDQGQPLPPGKYQARGYAVGELQIGGVGYFFNDWIDGDDTPRVRSICGLAARGTDLLVVAKTAGGALLQLRCDDVGKVTNLGEMRSTVNASYRNLLPGGRTPAGLSKRPPRILTGWK
jgi:hypothetical protein